LILDYLEMKDFILFMEIANQLQAQHGIIFTNIMQNKKLKTNGLYQQILQQVDGQWH